MSVIIQGYVVEELIQEGGFAAVYRAKRVSDKKILALKILTPKACEKSRNKSLLVWEMKLQQIFNHPNIIKFDSKVKDAPRPAFAMEYFESEHLKALCRKDSPIIAEHGVGILRKTLEALKHMHEKGYVHKDIKPENILVSETGNVKVIDFNIAEKVDFFSLFRPRRCEGTPLYMSPEQVTKKRLDQRSDLYSVGATFYEAFCGTPHITGSSEKDLLKKHITASIPKIRSLNKEVPHQIDNILLRMLHKKPDERYKTAAEALFHLNKYSTKDHLIAT